MSGGIQKQKDQSSVSSVISRVKQTDPAAYAHAAISADISTATLHKDSGQRASVPKQAGDKSVIGSIKNFFGFKKRSGSMSKNVVSDRVYDLDDEDRVSIQLRNRETAWDSVRELAGNMLDSKDFDSFSDETQKLVGNLYRLSDRNLGEDERTQFETFTLNRLRAFDADVREMRRLGTQAERDAAGEALKTKYKDPEIMSMISSVLRQTTQGSLLLDGKNVIDMSNDSGFTYLEQVDKTEEINDTTCHVIAEGYAIPDELKSDYAKRPLFTSDPCIEDVIQGDLGDCYLCASLGAVAEKDPQMIRDSMVDEGPTVTVRFYNSDTLTPIYVRVSKCIPHRVLKVRDDKGNEQGLRGERVGAEGAFWVNVYEKAFTAVRDQLESQVPPVRAGIYDRIDGGQEEIMLKIITGKQAVKKNLPGRHAGNAGYFRLSDLYLAGYDAEKERFRTGVARGQINGILTDWNIYKAARMLGVELTGKTDPLYTIIQKNRIPDQYLLFMSERLSSKFESEGNVDANTGRSVPGFKSTLDLDLFLDSIDIGKMPSFKLPPQYDETQMKKSFIRFFRDAVIRSGKLKNNICLSGDYSADELRVFDDLEKALGKDVRDRKAVTAGVDYHSLEYTGKGVLKGGNEEGIVAGLASTHAYTILGTTVREASVGKKTVTRRFVIVHNPWTSNLIRLYDMDTMSPFTNEADERMDGSSYDAKGTFMVELRDFCNSFSEYQMV